MYEFKQPPTTASKPQADTSDAGDQQQPQPVVQQVDGQAVVVLKFCRCMDCRKYETCPIGSDQPEHWLYCAMYRGPLLNDEYITVPNAPRGAGNTSPSVVRGHAAAVDAQTPLGLPAHEEGRMPAGRNEGGAFRRQAEHPTGSHCSDVAQAVNAPDAAPTPTRQTPHVGARANMSASVEHVARLDARTQQGPTGRVTKESPRLPLWQTNGSFPAEKPPVGTASSQPSPFCLSEART